MSKRKGHLWEIEGVPHKGWDDIEVNDLGEGNYRQCEMCGNEKIRFIHTMRHDDYHVDLDVGRVCAENMTDDYVGPVQRERALRNRAARRTKWTGRKWRRSEKGNLYINIRGINIVVCPNLRRLSEWGFCINGEFSRQTYTTIPDAQLAAFDVLENRRAEREKREREAYKQWLAKQ